MSKFWIVFKHEYGQVVRKKSFLVGIFLMPVLMAGFTVLPAVLARRKATSTQRLVVLDRTDSALAERFREAIKHDTLGNGEPYYEMTVVPVPKSEDAFVRLRDSLSREVNDKAIRYVLVLGLDACLDDTASYLITNADNIRIVRRLESHLSDALSAARLERSGVNLSVDSVLTLTRRIDLETRTARGESLPFLTKYIAALLFVGIMFGMIFGYGQLVMRSVMEEKNSRIMEVLVSSVSPPQLMFGKVFGLGAATFTQIAVWLIMGLGVYFLQSTLVSDQAIGRILFNPVIVVFFVLFFVSGYLFYSSLFALIGSIVNSDKEAQNFLSPIALAMVLPFVVAIHIAQEPHSVLSLTLSYIPFLTPTMMFMRVIFLAPTATSYSLFSGIVGEATLGLAVVLIATVLTVWLAAKVFRVGILMYGKRPTLPEIAKWVRY